MRWKLRPCRGCLDVLIKSTRMAGGSVPKWKVQAKQNLGMEGYGSKYWPKKIDGWDSRYWLILKHKTKSVPWVF